MTKLDVDRMILELRNAIKETSAEVKATALAVEATASEVRATAEQMKDTDARMKDTDARLKETDRIIKELGKQIGGIGNKFGSFTEGMAYSSIEKVLREKFDIQNIAPRLKVTKDDKVQEFDVLGYSNGSMNQAIAVEIKSNLNAKSVAQMKRLMEDFFYWLPEHKDKAVQGMICYVNGSKDIKDEILANGWHLLHVGDDVFKLEDPKGFKPKIYKAKK